MIALQPPVDAGEATRITYLLPHANVQSFTADKLILTVEDCS
jgi:hypothetical protein